VLAWQHFRSNVLSHAHSARQLFVNIIQKLVHLLKKGKLAMGSNFGLGERLEVWCYKPRKMKERKKRGVMKPNGQMTRWSGHFPTFGSTSINIFFSCGSVFP
jgi:hypothetical protein